MSHAVRDSRVSPGLTAAFDACADSVLRWRGDGAGMPQQRNVRVVHPPSGDVKARFERLMLDLRWSRRPVFVALRRLAAFACFALLVVLVEFLILARIL